VRSAESILEGIITAQGKGHIVTMREKMGFTGMQSRSLTWKSHKSYPAISGVLDGSKIRNPPFLGAFLICLCCRNSLQP